MFDKQVKELARIRDEGGLSLNPRSQRVTEIYILLEYNCPIIHIVEKYWEAYSTETELFEKLLEIIYRNNSQSCQRRLDL